MQWTKKARQYLLQEIHKDNQQFKEMVEKNVVLTLNQHNAKRKKYGLPPRNRIDKTIIKETILNIIFNDNAGDAERKETKEDKEINYDFKGGMYT